MLAREKVVYQWEELEKLGSRYHQSRKQMVLTFGAFDILHTGHLLYLEEASRFGDILVVGITSDSEVRKVKGPDRPINTEFNRALLVAGFACVDHVFVFDSDDCRMISMLLPDVCVYSETSEKKMDEREAERQLLEGHGGRIVCLPAASNQHSSDIISTLRSR